MEKAIRSFWQALKEGHQYKPFADRKGGSL
jgi:hypothetical protein